MTSILPLRRDKQNLGLLCTSIAADRLVCFVNRIRFAVIYVHPFFKVTVLSSRTNLLPK